MPVSFSRLHPNLGLWLMKSISKRGRLGESQIKEIKDKENEWLVKFARTYLQQNPLLITLYLVTGISPCLMAWHLLLLPYTIWEIGFILIPICIDQHGPQILHYEQ